MKCKWVFAMIRFFCEAIQRFVFICSNENLSKKLIWLMGSDHKELMKNIWEIMLYLFNLVDTYMLASY